MGYREEVFVRDGRRCSHQRLVIPSRSSTRCEAGEEQPLDVIVRNWAAREGYECALDIPDMENGLAGSNGGEGDYERQRLEDRSHIP